MKTHTGELREARKRIEQAQVPVDAQEHLLELLNLSTNITDDTTLQDEHIATHLVDVLSDSGNLLTLIQRQAAELDALKRITLNLTSSLDLQAVLDAIVREALFLIKDAQDVHIYMVHERNLVFGASLNNSGEKNVQYPKPVPDGVTGAVAREKKTIIIEDVTNHALIQAVPSNWRGSIIGIPLKVGIHIVGVMTLARTNPGDFSQAEIRLLNLLTEQAAIAILNARLHEAVTHQARSDSLTGLPNRRALDEHLDEEINRSKRSGIPFSVVMLDLDGFKVINDTLGHDVGDEVLRKIVHAIQKALRSTDFMARYGGDEMTIILPETNWPTVLIVTDKIQQELSRLIIENPNGGKFKLSVTGGVAVYPQHAKQSAGLLRTADEALYRAKRHRRGEVVQGRPWTGGLPPPESLIRTPEKPSTEGPSPDQKTGGKANETRIVFPTEIPPQKPG
jgi:diguanylate cyclase (GGDEF)-like protein